MENSSKGCEIMKITTFQSSFRAHTKRLLHNPRMKFDFIPFPPSSIDITSVHLFCMIVYVKASPCREANVKVWTEGHEKKKERGDCGT